MKQEHEYVDTYAKNLKAKDLFNGLRLELGVRSNNEHVGSGLGGNAAELLFLLTHKFTVVSGGSNFLTEKDGKFEFQINPDSKRVELRNILTSFVTNHPDFNPSITQKQLCNLSFVRDLPIKTLDVQLLIKSLETAYDVVQWLDLKLALLSKIDVILAKEVSALQIEFLREMGLPETYFKDTEDDREDPVEEIFNKHPIWGVRCKAARKRYNSMEDLLLSPEDLEKLNTIGSFQNYICLFSYRLIIGIERTVRLNLDEKLTFMKEVNKVIES